MGTTPSQQMQVGVVGGGIWQRIKANLLSYAFILPATALIIWFLLYPIGYIIYISFQKWNILLAPSPVGLANYRYIFSDSDFYGSIINTIYFVGLAVPLQMGLGLFFAVLLNNALKGRAIFRTIYFIPMAVSYVAAGIIFDWIFATSPLPGIAPVISRNLGIHFPDWQSTAGNWAMIIIIIMNTWKQTGYAMVIYLAGLQGINPDYYEAAQVDGVRNGWQMFRYISWPLLAPTTFLLIVTTTIFSFRAFQPFYVMTNGGPAGATTTMVFYVFQKFPDLMGISSAAATVMLVGVAGLTVAQFWANRRSQSYY
jgi:multiple sugar transport system permease protein